MLEFIKKRGTKMASRLKRDGDFFNENVNF